MLNIYKDQQHILYICPSHKWGARERMVIRDCLITKEIGHNAFIYCLKDSLLDIKAKELLIDRIHHQGKIRTKFFRWYKLRSLTQYIHRLNISIVHCYSLNFLWPTSLYLRRKPACVLVFTFNYKIKKIYKNFWFRPLVARLDVAFLPIKETFEEVRGHLDIPLRKVQFCGLGLSLNEKKSRDREIFSESEVKSNWLIGACVGGHEKKFSHLIPLLRMVKSINSRTRSGKKVKLILLSEKKWNKSLIFPELRSFVNTQELASDVAFENPSNLLDYLVEMDMWVSLPVEEFVEDYPLIALFNNIPVLSPRTSAFQEVLREYGEVGESYKIGDAREMRTKCEKILSKRSSYVNNIKKSADSLRHYFGATSYKNQVLNVYERALNKRKRYSDKFRR